MKRFLIVLLFLFLPFSFPTFISAANPDTTTTTSTTTNSGSNWWNDFWKWITGLFTKTDYTITSNRSSEQIRSDMTEYGGITDDTEKHSFAGSRLTDSNSQTCLKGNVIKQTVLNTVNYPDSELAEVCSNPNDPTIPCSVAILQTVPEGLTCSTKKISDLANYFVQLPKRFYCDPNKNELIDIGQDVIDAVANDSSLLEIPISEQDCYQKIYDDFYLTPKSTKDETEQNTKNMIQTPIPNGYQDSSEDHAAIRTRLDQNFSPANNPDSGLNGLRPASW